MTLFDREEYVKECSLCMKNTFTNLQKTLETTKIESICINKHGFSQTIKILTSQIWSISCLVARLLSHPGCPCEHTRINALGAILVTRVARSCSVTQVNTTLVLKTNTRKTTELYLGKVKPNLRRKLQRTIDQNTFR